MAVPDDTALKSLIDSNIPDATPTQQRRAKASFVRYVLYQLIDWVKSAINGNLSTWLRSVDNQPGGANGDSIYRAGPVWANGGLYAKGTATAVNMVDTGSSQAGLQIISPANNKAAYLEFHLTGLAIPQLGVDPDLVLKWRPYGGTAVYPVVISGISTLLDLTNALSNKKIALYGGASNDNQFFGFGLNASVLRYQVGSITDNHVFYAGLTPATSQELMRLQGNGNLGIGVVPTERLHVAGNALIQGEFQAGSLAAPTSIRTYGYFINYFMSALRAFRIGGATTTTGLTLKTTQYITIEIDGTSYKLALVN